MCLSPAGAEGVGGFPVGIVKLIDMEPITIGDDLIAKTITEDSEIERLARFSGGIHGEDVAGMTRELARSHPDSGAMHWLAVVQPSSQEILSTLSLLPWTLTYGGVPIKAAEMGIVATHAAWRRRGFIKVLTEQFNRYLLDEGYLLSHIQGIPFFYRQFGYEYAIPLEMHFTLELRHARGKARDDSTSKVSLTRADVGDISALQDLYGIHLASLDIAAARTDAQWEFILGASLKTGYAADTYLVQRTDVTAGYCRIARQGFGDGLIVCECSPLPYEMYPGLFTQFAAMAEEREKPYIRFNLEPGHPAVKAALDMGGKVGGGYQWQIRLPDPASFLKTVVPVLEQRLETGEFSSYSGMLKVNYYRDDVLIEIVDGKVHRIGNIENDGAETVHIPPTLLPPLFLGQRSLDECKQFYPDIRGSGRASRLFNALFPPLKGFLYSVY